MNSPFKKSSISEMCKQIVSAPVIFKMKDGTECLAFYNNEYSVDATKLYILFPETSIPKYIEGNDLYNLKDCILHFVSDKKALSLYNKVCGNHKAETVAFIRKLIDKAPKESSINTHVIVPSLHEVYNKKHACGLVKVANIAVPTMAVMKDLKDKTALEVIINGEIEYNMTFDSVYWAAGISSKEFTDLKVKLKDLKC